MFERYTDQARRVLFFARYEASELGSLSIEAEHLLLGILKEEKGLTGKIFAEHQMSYAAVRLEIAAAGNKVPPSLEIPFSEATKNALRSAAAEAVGLSHKHIGPEHLLLGLLAHEQGRTAAILTRHGLDLKGVRSQILTLLSEAPRGLRYDDVPGDIVSGVVYYVVASADGYIGPRDGGVKWLEPFRPSVDGFGYAAFYESIDAIVLGSRTYEQVLALGDWPYAGKPCWVCSARSLSAATPNIVVTNGNPRDVVAEIRGQGCRRIWLVGGAALASAFRDAGLITACIVLVIPVFLGDGIPIFDRPGTMQQLKLVHTKALSHGIVQNFYLLQGRKTA